MIQIYRVIAPLNGQHAKREPVQVEAFEPGDLVIVLSSEDSYTTFCRYDESQTHISREQFIVSDLEFERCTERHQGLVR